MSKLSEPCFIIYTLGLVIVWLLVITLAESLPSTTNLPSTAPSTAVTPTPIYRSAANPLEERTHERNCKALCEHCGCLGFYCGEECICECNNENSDTECIATMQDNARKLDIPFEILIQGPTRNNFVRNALEFEQNPERKRCRAQADINAARNKRSTVTIYRPPSLPLKGGGSAAINTLEPSSINVKRDAGHERHKRTVEHRPWFNSFGNNIVRPAPLRFWRNKEAAAEAEAVPVAQPKREIPKFDPAWLIDKSLQRLTRPAPVQQNPLKRQASAGAGGGGGNAVDNEMVSSRGRKQNEFREPKAAVKAFHHALEAVEQFPRVIKDTVSGLTNENSLSDTMNFFSSGGLGSGDLLLKSLPDDKFTLTMRKISQEPLQREVQLPSQEPPRGVLLPWLRNRGEALRQRWQDRF